MTAAFDLERYDAAVFDLDGTVWLGAGRPIPGAREFVERCRARGLAIAFATNAPRPAELLAEQLVGDGLARPGEPVITSTVVMVRAMTARGVGRVGAVVPAPMAEAMRTAGIEIVDPADEANFGPVGSDRALVMGASRHVTIGDIERLGRLAAAGHRLFVVSTDPGYPVADGIEPGSGALLAALTAMHDVGATVVGKPSADYAAAVAEALGDRDRLVLFGDSQRADMGTADRLGADGVLLTEHSIEAFDRSLPMPTYIARSLADTPVPTARF